jgi:UDP-2,3-diacylglucosamine pyrophosphatase LpxH
MKKYKTICISDTHLGAGEAKAELLDNFLKNNDCENLFLIGDIIDGWKIHLNKWKWKQSHTNVIRRILGFSKKGTKVVYITGNHDEFLRPFVNYFSLGKNIVLCNQTEYTDLNGRRFLITHGDMFDGISSMAKWISVLGDHAYDVVLWINTKFNYMRHKLGFSYWSLSKFLKRNVKNAVGFVFKFEETITDYCAKRGYDGVICGHIHTPEIKVIRDIIYMNDGDWVESCSALVETHEGEWKIIYWSKIK